MRPRVCINGYKIHHEFHSMAKKLTPMMNWEDMQFDCLSIIFSKLSIGDLTASVPFACKSWSQAISSQPSVFYEILDFRFLDLNASSSSSFFKLAIARSRGAALELRFPSLFPPSIDVLSLASVACPRLRSLCLPEIGIDDEARFVSAVIGGWRDLERLEMESKPSNFRALAERIGAHCPKFRGLRIRGLIEEEDAKGIVSFLPRIEDLDLSECRIRKEEVLRVMDGCRELKRLSLKDCVGVEADEEVRRRGRGIHVLDLEGCRAYSIEEDLDHMFTYYEDCFEMWMF